MKFRYLLFCFLLLQSQQQKCVAFENLDFEEAMPVLVGDYETDRLQEPEDVLPHWSVSPEPGEELYLTYNDYGHIGFDPPIIGVHGGDDFTSYGFQPIEGEYSVLLDPRGGMAFLSQTGEVPISARSVRFSGIIAPDFILGVSLSDTASSPPKELGEVPGLTAGWPSNASPVVDYGVNIPPGVAGTEATLTFIADADPYLDSPWMIIDDVRFSPIPVPEPGSWLLLLGSAAWFTHRRV